MRRMPTGTKSCTEAGSNQVSLTRQGPKLFIMSTASQLQTALSSCFTRYRDMLLADPAAHLDHDPGNTQLHNPRALPTLPNPA